MLLAIDTATRTMSLALHDGRQLVYEHTWYTANNHTIELAPAIHTALRAHHFSPTDLAAVAVAQGPGSFTGLRIGISAAKGLSTACNLPLIAIPTLPILAAAIPRFDGHLWAVLQAGRGRICAQSFMWETDSWQPSAEAEITTWSDLVTRIQNPALVAGEVDLDGAICVDSAPLLTLASAAYRLRRAGFLAELAWARLRAGRTDNPATVTPIYLHQPGVPHP